MIARIFGAIAAGLRSARYFLGDLFYLATRPFRGLGARLRSRWSTIPAVWRVRGAVVGGALAVVALAAFVVVPNLPCSFPGGDACAPDDDAVEIVPENALAYVHVNVDAGSDAAADAAAIAERTPLLSRQVLAQAQAFLLGGAGEAPNFEREVEPWFGGEMAVAVVPGSAGTQQVQLLEIADERGARDYESSIGAGRPTPDEYQGVEIREDDRGLATAVVSDFLVIGSADGVRSVIDVSVGNQAAGSLADDKAAADAMEMLPEDTFAQAYLSREGIDSFIALSDGALAPLEPFVDSGNAEGAAFSLSAGEDGFELAARSVLDPQRDPERGGFFTAFPPFEPGLPAELAPDTLVYAGFGDADKTVSALLEQATVRAPGIASGLTDLVDRLRKDAGVDLTKDLLPALNGEGAIVLAPRPVPENEVIDPAEDEVPDELQDPSAPERILEGQNDLPYLALYADDVSSDDAAGALARLQKELARSVDPSIANPVFRQQDFGEVEAQVLRRSPADVIAYAIFDGVLVISDDTAPIERLGGADDGGLEGADSYSDATTGLAEEPAAIAYLDLAGLVEIAERLGAGLGGPFATFAEDLRRLQTFAVTIGIEEDVLASDARLRIGAP